MDTQGFEKTYKELSAERDELFDQLTDLETEVSEVRSKLAHLNEALSHLAPLAGFRHATHKDIPSMGITDAIRSVLQRNGTKMSAKDVREKLAESGYDFSGLSSPMASIYTILGRLEDSKEIAKTKEEGRSFFEWIMTDDDIPF